LSEVTTHLATDFGGLLMKGLAAAPPSPADAKAVSATVAAPPTAEGGTPFTVTVGGTVHNNGPTLSVNVDAVVQLSPPAGCSTSSTNPVTVQDLTLVASIVAQLPQQSVQGGNQQINASVTAVIDDPAAEESNPSSNQTSGYDIVTVFDPQFTATIDDSAQPDAIAGTPASDQCAANGAPLPGGVPCEMLFETAINADGPPGEEPLSGSLPLPLGEAAISVPRPAFSIASGHAALGGVPNGSAAGRAYWRGYC